MELITRQTMANQYYANTFRKPGVRVDSSDAPIRELGPNPSPDALVDVLVSLYSSWADRLQVGCYVCHNTVPAAVGIEVECGRCDGATDLQMCRACLVAALALIDGAPKENAT